ncbi:hypothetical protein RISK_006007 [Rhodopirellula islandica]|uniref:Uncharacterized protein n=1 Tax=Rhodopirellula islandica TaxID=595434 RepID=A0A0J1B5D6_RHOIS|nr:hypothetical protein RISK_006007 [Rhodopirellula islandica]
MIPADLKFFQCDSIHLNEVKLLPKSSRDQKQEECNHGIS